MKNERYYYMTLSANEKAAYRMIYYGIQSHALNIVVPVEISPQSVQDVYLKVLYDNPSFFFINQTVIRLSGQPGYYVLLPEYLYTNTEIGKLEQDVRNVLNRINVKARTMLSNEFRLEKYLHDSIVKSVSYDYEALNKNDCFNAHSIIGALLDKNAVCEGIAKAFKLLCNEYGIKCIVALGKADPKGQFDGDTYHAWNVVKVGNGSYHVDVTWDNMFDRQFEHISYDYFNVTTDDILKDHLPLGKLPPCNDTGLNYFYCTKSFVSTFQELVSLLTQRRNARSIMFKAVPGSKDFGTIEEFKSKTYFALMRVILIHPTTRKHIVLFNESQWIGKVLFFNS